MPNWSGTVLTNKGLALQAKVEAGTVMNITKLKIGDGILSSGQTVAALNDLVLPKKIIDISALTPLENGICKILGVVTNDGIEAGFYVRELGVFAQDPDVGEILYAYTSDGSPDYLPAEGGPVAISEELIINLAFSNTATITANIAMDGLVTVNVLNNAINVHNLDEDAHAAAISQHNTSLTAHKDLLHLWQPGHTYAVGDIAYNHNLPSWAYLECVQQGTSGSDDNIFTEISSGGGVISDNTISWAVRDLRAGTAVGKIPALIDIGSGVAGLPRVPGAVPPGMIGFFSISTPPTGWLKANGSAVSRTAYAALFAVIGTYYGVGDGSTTFNLPELRGEFIRGWDDGRGIDSGRTLGIVQGHALQEHNHFLPTTVGTGDSRWGIPDSTWIASDGNEYPVSGTSPAMTFPGHNIGNFASETRPRNQALLACIKY